MTPIRSLAPIVAVLALAIPAAAAHSPPPPDTRPPAREGAAAAVAHEELGRACEELAGQLRGLGARFREHFLPGDPQDRPLITLMLHYRTELALTPQQVDTLERLRSDFQREAIRRDADLRGA